VGVSSCVREIRQGGEPGAKVESAPVQVRSAGGDGAERGSDLRRRVVIGCGSGVAPRAIGKHARGDVPPPLHRADGGHRAEAD
jgi:hypothetical protein